MDIAFLGAGIMGVPMMRRLAAAGYRTSAWDRSPERTQTLRGDGLVVAESAAEAVAGCDLLVSMLSTAAATDEVLFDQGVAEALRPGAIVVVMSSIPVEAAREHAHRFESRGIAYLDAPVSGGERGAIEGTLTIFVGGPAEAIARVCPVLSVLGRVNHVGPTGAGQLAKLANQLIVGVTIGAVAEAVLLIERGGGDVARVLEALRGGFADSKILREHGARMAQRRFAPGGKASLQRKDLRTTEALATMLGLELPFLSLATALYEDMCQGERAELDHSALYLELADRAGGGSSGQA